MNTFNELFTISAGFIGTAFAILRMAMGQTKGFAERLIALIEDSLRKQDETIAGFRESVEKLNSSVQENTLVTRQVAEWLQISTPVGGPE